MRVANFLCCLCLTQVLSAQDLQLGLDRQSPRALEIQPPSGYLRLDSASSWALSLRGGWDIWKPREGQVLELTGGVRLPSERQLTFRNSAGASGDVVARLRLDLQPALGALYRFEHPFGWPLETGLGLEARREKLVMKDGGLESAGTLNRVWVRGVLRHRFAGDRLGPFVALELAIPLNSAPTPSGVDYLNDLDHLGSSTNPGTAAKAHAPTLGLTLAFGYRFGRRPPVLVATQTRYELPESPVLASVPPEQVQPVLPETPPVIKPAAPRTIILDEAALHFALDRSDIPAQGIEVLKAWAARLKALPKPPVITISGHTDATGSKAHNQKLSLARAQSVAEVLKAEGLAVEKSEGLGPDQPLADNNTAEGRAKNRRVEIHLEGEGVEVKGRAASELVTETDAKRKPRVPGKKHATTDKH